MLPNHLALVPINPFQLAAIQAIASVESNLDAGRSLRTHPYAKALFRVMNNGRAKITVADIRIIDACNDPRAIRLNQVTLYRGAGCSNIQPGWVLSVTFITNIM